MKRRSHTHEDFARDQEVKTSTDRTFGFVIAAVFVAFGIWPLFSEGQPRWSVLVVGGVVVVIAMLCPSVLRPLNRLWTQFGLLLHRVTNPVLMGLVFFLVVTPIGLVMRVMGKDPLHLRIDRDTASYWISRDPPGPAPDSMKNQF